MPKPRRLRAKHSAPAVRGLHRNAPKEPFEAEVRDLASDGRGVVSAPNGQVVFVSGVWPGERVRVLIRGIRGKVADGELVSVIACHPDRRTPPCGHHGFLAGTCGGCSWQFMTYEAQFQAKRHRLETMLERLPGQMPAIDCFPAPDEWGYRNRAQFKSNGEQLGFVSHSSKTIADIVACPVLTNAASDKLKQLREALPESAWRPRRRQTWTTLDVDDERETVLVNERQTFRQGNTAQNRVMGDWLAEQLEVTPPGSKVLELFAGGGNFTRRLCNAGFQVVAVEVDVSALASLAERFEEVRTEPCDLFDPDAARSLARRCADATTLLLDPPREGLLTREVLLPELKALEQVLYISCDPASWFRDVSYCLSLGFELTRIGLIDLFPQTPHIEVMSVLRRS